MLSACTVPAGNHGITDHYTLCGCRPLQTTLGVACSFSSHSPLMCGGYLRRCSEPVRCPGVKRLRRADPLLQMDPWGDQKTPRGSKIGREKRDCRSERGKLSG